MNNKRCSYCKSHCIRKGKLKNIQRYQCVICKKYVQSSYSKKRNYEIDLTMLKKLHNVGLGISGIASVMEISKTSVQRKIQQLAKELVKPKTNEENQEYEVDELRTYIGNKRNESWVIYAINKKTKQVIDFVVGRRTKENLKKLIDRILSLNPKKIYTDFLNIYPTLIPKTIHKQSKSILSIIERKNLTLRTHLKRLNRKTICYSKSEMMLENSIKIYFFG